MEAQLQVTAIATPTPPLPQPILTTSRLLVRPLHPEDSYAMSLSANSPLVAKHMSLFFPHPYTLAHSEAWIALNAAKSRQEHFGICERCAPDVVIGGIGLKPGADVHLHTAEVGFWVGEKYWGNGYTTEVLEGFTRWTFLHNEIGGKRTTRLWGGVFSGNGASMRCFEKCGYVREGVLKEHCEKHGEVMDLHVFGLTKSDWELRVSGIDNKG